VAHESAPSRMPWWLLATFVALTAALGLVGAWLYRQQRDWLTDVSRRAMVTTTATRVRDLVAWRDERLAEGAALKANRQFVECSTAALAPTATPATILAWSGLLDVIRSRRDYVAAALLSADGQYRRVVGNVSPSIREHLAILLPEVLRSGRADLSDPFPIEGGRVPGRYARLAIADSGTGIAPQLLSMVFDPYFTTKQQGSGLGLAISHSIVVRHGGFIGVQSQLGAGTRFEILLPACEARPAEPVVLERCAPSRLERVLVMDDEADVRALALRMLGRLGIEGVGVSAGDEALRVYRDALQAGKPFDAVIMDLTIIGGMGGKETVAALLEFHPAATVIVSSGYSTDPIMARFGDYGFKAVLAKPYRLEEMRAVLASVVPGGSDISFA
jgi:CheY-like chemotaxis protein